MKTVTLYHLIIYVAWAKHWIVKKTIRSIGTIPRIEASQKEEDIRAEKAIFPLEKKSPHTTDSIEVRAYQETVKNEDISTYQTVFLSLSVFPRWNVRTDLKEWSKATCKRQAKPPPTISSNHMKLEVSPVFQAALCRAWPVQHRPQHRQRNLVCYWLRKVLYVKITSVAITIAIAQTYVDESWERNWLPPVYVAKATLFDRQKCSKQFLTTQNYFIKH